MADALNLVSAVGFALWLESRAGLPVSVTVRAAARNPWVGGCPTVTVEALATTGALLDRKTFRLVDGWSWTGWAGEDELDCVNTATLIVTGQTGYTGPVVFVLKDGDGVEVGRSAPVSLAELPDGGAIDEGDDDPWWAGGGGSDGDRPGLIGDVASLVKWGIVGVVVFTAAPLVRDFFDRD